VADAVTRILEILDAHPRDQWESALCRHLGGHSYYIASCTGRAQVRELIRLGVPARSARAKVYGR
jgi:hypothetical protein